MSARDDHPLLHNWSSERPDDFRSPAMRDAFDEIDRLRAHLSAFQAAMNVLGKAARDGSDMLYFLRTSEGVQSWHEDKLDDIDRCIAAIECAPARVDFRSVAGETAATTDPAPDCRAKRFEGTPQHDGPHAGHLFTYGPHGMYTGSCTGRPS